MKIKGLIEESMLDWPGKIAMLLFTGGCNLNCPYCHNPQFVENYEQMPDISQDDIFEMLKRKKNWLDGIVISGGEPTLQNDLPLFLMDVKQMGYKTKIETNGTNSKMIEFILSNELADCISMDIKWSPEKYNHHSSDIMESIRLLKSSGIDYEFNTTVVPGIVEKEDIIDICRLIKGAKKYTLQQFKSEKISLLDKSFMDKKPYSREELRGFLQIAKDYVNDVQIR